MRFFSEMSRRILLFCLPLLFTLSLNASQATEHAHLEIENSKTWIGIAKVKLSVDKLVKEDGYLVGNYTIKVPLMKSQNDQGRIKIPLKLSLESLSKKGGTIEGKAYSNKPNKKPNSIVCEVLPQNDQMILLAITTEDRTIHFESRYTVVKTKDSTKDESSSLRTKSNSISTEQPESTEQNPI